MKNRLHFIADDLGTKVALADGGEVKTATVDWIKTEAVPSINLGVCRLLVQAAGRGRRRASD